MVTSKYGQMTTCFATDSFGSMRQRNTYKTLEVIVCHFAETSFIAMAAEDWSLARLRQEIGERLVPVHFLDQYGIVQSVHKRQFCSWDDPIDPSLGMEGVRPAIRGADLCSLSPSLARTVGGPCQARQGHRVLVVGA